MRNDKVETICAIIMAVCVVCSSIVIVNNKMGPNNNFNELLCKKLNRQWLVVFLSMCSIAR